MYNPNYLYPQQPNNNGIIWVQGIEGAKAYQIPANSNVILMDNEIDGRFYIKVSDNIGMCNLRIFNFQEVTRTQVANDSKYVTREEVEKMIKELREQYEQPIQGTNSKPNYKPNESNGKQYQNASK